MSSLNRSAELSLDIPKTSGVCDEEGPDREDEGDDHSAGAKIVDITFIDGSAYRGPTKSTVESVENTPASEARMDVARPVANDPSAAGGETPIVIVPAEEQDPDDTGSQKTQPPQCISVNADDHLAEQKDANENSLDETVSSDWWS